MTDAQLRYSFGLMAADLSTDEVLITCLIQWSRLKVIGRQPDGAYLMKKGKTMLEVSALAIAELSKEIGRLGQLPATPVRPSAIGNTNAIAADFQGVPFETFIISDNLYQGYLQTQQDTMLDELAGVLYPGVKKISEADRIAIFYWIASLKEYFACRFSDFFQPVASADGNLLGSPNMGAMLQEAMDAQIRALTKGDITKGGRNTRPRHLAYTHRA